MSEVPSLSQPNPASQPPLSSFPLDMIVPPGVPLMHRMCVPSAISPLCCAELALAPRRCVVELIDIAMGVNVDVIDSTQQSSVPLVAIVIPTVLGAQPLIRCPNCHSA